MARSVSARLNPHRLLRSQGAKISQNADPFHAPGQHELRVQDLLVGVSVRPLLALPLLCVVRQDTDAPSLIRSKAAMLGCRLRLRCGRRAEPQGFSPHFNIGTYHTVLRFSGRVPRSSMSVVLCRSVLSFLLPVQCCVGNPSLSTLHLLVKLTS